MSNQRTFGRLVPECKERGIGRTKAFDLAAKGILETFRIGNARYVTLRSLDSLPEKAKEEAL